MRTLRRIGLSLGAGALLVGAASANFGCADTANRFIADSTGDMILAAAPKLNALTDYELFSEGIAGSLLMMESVLAVSPDNPFMRVELAKNYASYAYGFLEDRYEKVERDGDMDRADELRARARNTYLRARDLCVAEMRRRHNGIDHALDDPEQRMATYLDDRYPRKADAPLLFWAAMGWGSAINLGRDNPELIADLGTVKTIAAHALKLDAGYFYGGPAALLGAMEAAIPEALGGNPTEGKKLFERALKLGERRNHVLLVQYARAFAMPTGDRELYLSLLQEVMDAPDQGDDVRLPNVIARKRAERYIEDVDDDVVEAL